MLEKIIKYLFSVLLILKLMFNILEELALIFEKTASFF
jgi:hypothetical protein